MNAYILSNYHDMLDHYTRLLRKSNPRLVRVHIKHDILTLQERVAQNRKPDPTVTLHTAIAVPLGACHSPIHTILPRHRVLRAPHIVAQRGQRAALIARKNVRPIRAIVHRARQPGIVRTDNHVVRQGQRRACIRNRVHGPALLGPVPDAVSAAVELPVPAAEVVVDGGVRDAAGVGGAIDEAEVEGAGGAGFEVGAEERGGEGGGDVGEEGGAARGAAGVADGEAETDESGGRVLVVLAEVDVRVR